MNKLKFDGMEFEVYENLVDQYLQQEHMNEVVEFETADDPLYAGNILKALYWVDQLSVLEGVRVMCFNQAGHVTYISLEEGLKGGSMECMSSQIMFKKEAISNVENRLKNPSLLLGAADIMTNSETMLPQNDDINLSDEGQLIHLLKSDWIGGKSVTILDEYINDFYFLNHKPTIKTIVSDLLVFIEKSIIMKEIKDVADSKGS